MLVFFGLSLEMIRVTSKWKDELETIWEMMLWKLRGISTCFILMSSEYWSWKGKRSLLSKSLWTTNQRTWQGEFFPVTTVWHSPRNIYQWQCTSQWFDIRESVVSARNLTNEVSSNYTHRDTNLLPTAQSAYESCVTLCNPQKLLLGSALLKWSGTASAGNKLNRCAGIQATSCEQGSAFLFRRGDSWFGSDVLLYILIWS